MSSGNSPRRAVRQPRRRRFDYRASIERRAVVAAGLVEQNGWPAKQAASLLCVNPVYVGLARHLGADDRSKLARGELKLAALHKDHLRHLAESRAQRAAEREANIQAKREAEVQAEVQAEAQARKRWFDWLVDRIVTQFGPEPLLEELDAAMQRRGRDPGEVVVSVLGPARLMAALDAATAPPNGNGARA